MLVLDTDLLSIVQRKVGEEYSRLNERLEAASATQPVWVTIISLEEQARGWLAQIARARPMGRLIEAYRRFHLLFSDYAKRRILDFDDLAAARYEGLLESKIRIGTMDQRIAAIALAHDATLLSRNLSDFRKVPGLQVEDWTRPTPHGK